MDVYYRIARRRGLGDVLDVQLVDPIDHVTLQRAAALGAAAPRVGPRAERDALGRRGGGNGGGAAVEWSFDRSCRCVDP